MMLIMFPKHILGPYPHCRELSIYPFFCFHIVLLLLKHLWLYLRHCKGRGMLLDLSFSRREICHVRCRQHSLILPVKRLPCSQVGICCMSNMKSKYCESLMLSIFLSGPIFSSGVFSPFTSFLCAGCYIRLTRSLNCFSSLVTPEQNMY